MNVTPRLLACAVLGSSVLGGAVGALATAATSSQANPAAIAAAVQQVSDRQTQKELRGVIVGLLNVQGELEPMRAKLDETAEALTRIRENSYGTNSAPVTAHPTTAGRGRNRP
jgi:hypothetical protein